jgi:hypothetical protein
MQFWGSVEFKSPWLQMQEHWTKQECANNSFFALSATTYADAYSRTETGSSSTSYAHPLRFCVLVFCLLILECETQQSL